MFGSIIKYDTEFSIDFYIMENDSSIFLLVDNNDSSILDDEIDNYGTRGKSREDLGARTSQW
jgi:hypothetical protein